MNAKKKKLKKIKNNEVNTSAVRFAKFKLHLLEFLILNFGGEGKDCNNGSCSS